MKDREPLPAWVAEEQRERLQMEKIMADIEYLRKKHSLDMDELYGIGKELNKAQAKADGETE